MVLPAMPVKKKPSLTYSVSNIQFSNKILCKMCKSIS